MKVHPTLVRRIPRAVREALARLHDHGFQAFPVGGGVRDLMLGRPVADWDVATSARPDQVTGLFAKVIPTGIAHGTVTAMLRGRAIEITTFRGEIGYQDGRHPDQVVFLDSLEEDLARRDFTVNAMAIDLAHNELIDPFEGQEDLHRGLIRAVGDPKKRFNEDGLRPLRAIRFACVLNFEIEPATLAAIEDSILVFRKVALERVREELQKIVGSKQAAKGIELLRQSRLLAEILPELLTGVGFPQNQFHRFDVYQHALVSLRHSKAEAIVKLAVLLHDIGKPAAAGGPSGEHTFYGHEKTSAQLADQILERLRYSNEERRRVHTVIGNHMFHYQENWTDGAVRRLIRKVGVEYLPDLWEIRRADAWGRGMEVRASLANLRALKKRVAKLMEKDAVLKVLDLDVNGTELMQTLAVEPGPLIGKILDELLERVLDDPAINKKQDLIEIAKNLMVDFNKFSTDKSKKPTGE